MRIGEAVVALSIVATGLPLAAQVQSASLDVVDSNGTTIGHLVDLLDAQTANVATLIDGHPAVINVESGRFNGLVSGTVTVFFTSSDCTGQAYALKSQAAPFASFGVQALAGPSPTFYFAASPAPQAVTYNSALFLGSPCAVQPPQTDMLTPVIKLRDLTFVAPFDIQGAPTVSASVPAISNTGLAILAILVSAAGAFFLRYRLTTQPRADRALPRA